MSTMVRMPVELKEKLEGLKDQFNKKSIYDMIEHLIETVDRQKNKISELQKDKEQEQSRREAEDIYLGVEMKQEFTKFQQEIKLRMPAHAVELLIANFDGSLTMSRAAFDTYVRLK